MVENLILHVDSLDDRKTENRSEIRAAKAA